MILTNIEVIKETEKAINVKYQSRFFWVPKSLAMVAGTEMQVEDWFYKKEIADKLPTVKSILNKLGSMTGERGLPAQLQALGLI